MTSNVLLKGIKTNFMGMMEQSYPNALDFLCEKVNSNSDQEFYWIPLTGSGVNELLDEVQLGELADKNYTIQNKDFYNGIRENRNTMEDSKEYLGASVEMKIRSIADDWKWFPRKLTEDLLKNGASTSLGLAFDGTAYFSTARSNIASAISSTGISNTGTGGGVTLALIEADLSSAKTQLMSFKDKNGNPFNADPDLYALVPVALMDTFNRLLSPSATVIDTTGTSKSNILAGTMKVIPIWGSSNNTWYLANANSRVKPFIIQNRTQPEWFMEDNPKFKYVDFFMKARVGAGYGTPWSMVRVST